MQGVGMPGHQAHRADPDARRPGPVRTGRRSVRGPDLLEAGEPGRAGVVQHVHHGAPGPLQRAHQPLVQRQFVPREHRAGGLQVQVVGDQHRGDLPALADQQPGQPVVVEVGLLGDGCAGAGRPGRGRRQQTGQLVPARGQRGGEPGVPDGRCQGVRDPARPGVQRLEHPAQLVVELPLGVPQPAGRPGPAGGDGQRAVQQRTQRHGFLPFVVPALTRGPCRVPGRPVGPRRRRRARRPPRVRASS